MLFDYIVPRPYHLLVAMANRGCALLLLLAIALSNAQPPVAETVFALNNRQAYSSKCSLEKEGGVGLGTRGDAPTHNSNTLRRSF